MPDFKTEGDLIFWDILKHPEDDAVRLIYADWLSENGNLPRAYDIRYHTKYKNTYTRHSKNQPTHRYYTFPRDPLTQWGESDTIPTYCERGADHRGFMYCAELTLEKYMAFVDHLFTHYPITKIFIIDKDPVYTSFSQIGDKYFWKYGDSVSVSAIRYILPVGLKNYVGDRLHDTRDSAKEALSNGLVRFGRKRVGLD